MGWRERGSDPIGSRRTARDPAHRLARVQGVVTAACIAAALSGLVASAAMAASAHRRITMGVIPHSHVPTGRSHGHSSAARAACVTPGALCIPTGIAELEWLNGGPECEFNGEFTWGDGSHTFYANIHAGEQFSHDYGRRPKLYLATWRTYGTPLEPGTICPEDSGVIQFEVPPYETTLETSLMGGDSPSEQGPTITVSPGTAVTDQATLSGEPPYVEEAEGTVEYVVYSDDECIDEVAAAGTVEVEAGAVPESEPETLPPGTYYWKASYSGDELNAPSESDCGGEIEVVQQQQGPLVLEQVNFINNEAVLIDHTGNTIEPAKSIRGFGGDDEIEWKAEPNTGDVLKNWPVAYVQGTKIELEARFAVPETTKEYLENDVENLTLTGTTTLHGTTITFTKRLTADQLRQQLHNHGAYLDTELLETSGALPTEVAAFTMGTDPMRISWESEVDEIGGTLPIREQVGASTHNLFLTFAPVGHKVDDAQPVPIYFTVLDAETEDAEQAVPTRSATVSGVWRAFSSEVGGIPNFDVRTYNPATGDFSVGNPLTYYQVYQPLGETYKQVREAYDTPGSPFNLCANYLASLLVEHFKGQCGSWAELLNDALADEGIGSEHIWLAASPQYLPPSAWSGYRAARATLKLLVREWTFAKAGTSGVPQFPYTESELTDAAGIAGQNDANPPPAFDNHQIVRVKEGAVEELYDPSYGAGPIPAAGSEPLLDYQEVALAGFCTNRRVEVHLAAGWFPATLPAICEQATPKQRIAVTGAVEFAP